MLERNDVLEPPTTDLELCSYEHLEYCALISLRNVPVVSGSALDP